MKVNMRRFLALMIIFVMLFTGNISVFAETLNNGGTPSTEETIPEVVGVGELIVNSDGEGDGDGDEVIPEYIEAVVPAIWYPIDPETNEVIEGLNLLKTDPYMFDIPEVARLKEDGQYYIQYWGENWEGPNSMQSTNFVSTGSLFFTDKFHRIVMQGYPSSPSQAPPTLSLPASYVSAVRKLVYGNHQVENYNDGLHGGGKAIYQEDETMHLYVAVVEGDLTEGNFNSNEINVLKYTHNQIKSEILGNIEEIRYQNIKNGVPFSEVGQIITLGPSDLDVMFIYQYNTEGGGEFLSSEGIYINYMDEGLSSLEPGKYEAVFPTHWKEKSHYWLGGPEKFSRNRYTYDDTVHFTVNLLEPEPLMSKDVEGKEEHSLSNRNDKFTYNIKVNLPGGPTEEGDVPGAIPQSLLQSDDSSEGSEEMEVILVIEDTLEDALEILGVKVLLDGFEFEELTDLVEIDGQKVSLSIDDDYIDEIIGRELTLQIRAKIRANANLSKYEDRKIPNNSSLYFDGYEEWSDPVYVIFPRTSTGGGGDPDPVGPVDPTDPDPEDDTEIDVEGETDIPEDEDDTVIEVEDEVDIPTLPKTGSKSSLAFITIGIALLTLGLAVMSKKEERS